MPPAGGPGLGNPFAGILSDLSSSLSPEWQSVDLAIRALKVAKRGVGMQKLPAVVAVLTSVQSTLETVLSGYTSGTSGAAKPSTSGAERSAPMPSDNAATDADGQPGADDEGGGDADQ
jgi:hypothetical protein